MAMCAGSKDARFGGNFHSAVIITASPHLYLSGSPERDAHIVGYYALEQRVKPSEGLGHQGGVLSGLIQDPACGLRRISIPRTPVNKPLIERLMR
jgi:hypothetical protein